MVKTSGSGESLHGRGACISPKPTEHTTFTFCYARLWTEIKMWLYFFSLFFLFWTAHVGQGPRINLYYIQFILYQIDIISWSDIPFLFHLSCWATQDTAQIAAKFPGNLFLSEIEQVHRQNPAPLCAVLAAKEVEACPKFYRNILHWNFNLV